MERIELDKVFTELLTPKIILVTTKNNVVLDVDDLRNIKSSNLKLSNGCKYGLISDSGNYSSVTPESRVYMASKKMEKNRIATAFIISSLSQRLLVNFFMKLNKPSVPTKVFSNLSEARKWMDKKVNQQ